MAGIYIKGVDLPKGSTELLLAVRADGEVFVGGFGYCGEAQAIPVPDHGRLGDLDALGIAELEERVAKRADRVDWMDEYIVGIVDGLHEANRRIVNAPTVIPEDKGASQ